MTRNNEVVATPRLVPGWVATAGGKQAPCADWYPAAMACLTAQEGLKETQERLAWELAEKVRTDLDMQSCPGAYMDLAMESIVKHCAALLQDQQGAFDERAHTPLAKERIIAIRQATRATSAEAWGDTVAFVRAIEKEKDSRNPLRLSTTN